MSVEENKALILRFPDEYSSFSQKAMKYVEKDF